MSMHIPKVLVFDSGLGGLSILHAIQNNHPACQLVYCSDNEAFPYGTKSESDLINRVSRVLLQLNQRCAPDIVVIACNTASTVALPRIRSLISVPVVGVVPAIKPAAQVARTRSIGLLATPGTISRSYTQALIDQFASGFNWIKVGSSELVKLAENKMYGESFSADDLQKIIRPLAEMPAAELDTVVLACTHFPLLINELREALPQIKYWVDSSDAIAKRVGFWLHETGFHDERTSLPGTLHELLFTQPVSDSKRLAFVMKNSGFHKTDTLMIT